MRLHLLPCLLGLALAHAQEVPPLPRSKALEPNEAAASFVAMEGFSMQLLAAEPLVTDPVALTYDERGRAFVCEMNDYPYTDKASHRPSQENPQDQAIGRVRLLWDSDANGSLDKATLFAEGLSWPTGAACWKGGIFVVATPDLWYLRDEDGDGRADLRLRCFTGLRKLNVQAVANNPQWGPDGRLYIAGGSNGGELRRLPDADRILPRPAQAKPLVLRRHDFSLDPQRGELRLESGGARFGHSIDDQGNRFLCNIRNPFQQVALPQAWLDANPLLPALPVLVDCAAAGDQLPVYRSSPVEPWRDFRAKRWSDEGSHLPHSELVGAGVVTSSSGITLYRGDAYPAAFRRQAFVADVAGNLFYRMAYTMTEGRVSAQQMDEHQNFLTSRDVWFRPVNFTNAPDGCLHVCDMYREVIEHPWSIPDDLHARLDLLNGRQRGRLWRLAPPGKLPRDHAVFDLGALKTSDLVSMLDHPNGWHRDSARRLLWERRDASAIVALQTLMLAKATRPAGRVAALWMLETLGAIGPRPMADLRARHRLEGRQSNDAAWLEECGVSRDGLALLLQAAQHPQAELRLAALQVRPAALLAPRHLGEWYQCREDAARLLRDADSNVATAAVSAHALISNPAALPLVAQLCRQHPHSQAMHEAALLAAGAQPFLLLQPLLQGPALEGQLMTLALQLSEMIGRGHSQQDPDAAGHLFAALNKAGAGPSNLGLLAALQRGLQSRAGGLLKALPEAQTNDAILSPWRDLARQQLAKDPASSAALVVALLPSSEATQRLAAELQLKRDPAENLLLLEALASQRSEGAFNAMLEAWPRLSPQAQDKALLLMLSSSAGQPVLLKALQSGRLRYGTLSPTLRAAMSRISREPMASALKSLTAAQPQSSRVEILTRYAKSLELKGDARRGLLVYEKACAACHRFAQKGRELGPHLATISSWDKAQILANILDPNREVSPNFSLHQIETQDGNTLSALIRSESQDSLQLKGLDGSDLTLQRHSIKRLNNLGISPMPEGLESQINLQEMADLISLLKPALGS